MIGKIIENIFILQNLDNSPVYINSVISGAVNFPVFISAGFAINKLGKKTLVGKLSFFVEFTV